MLITDVLPIEDGHAQERRVIDQVLSRVREGELWIEDRNFCTRSLMFGMARRGAAFLVRQHAQLTGGAAWDPHTHRGRPQRDGV